jgi:NAD(P)-dependent dehydrogenase (short-subunit alcohol dehydrogenase family)
VYRSNQLKDISNMSVLITGGGSGIGEGIAEYYVAKGAKVTICGRRADRIDAVASRLGNACRAVQADVTSDTDRQQLVEAALDHGGRLDALISNAGNMVRGDIDRLQEDDLVDIFRTNVIAGMMLTGLCKQRLSEHQGAVIFVGSIHTRRAFPGASAYAATKGALETLTRVLAAELGEARIRVNCVVPGAVQTEIYQRAGLLSDDEVSARMQSLAGSHALGRIGTTKEIAEAVDYLVRGEWTTGAILDIDGGLGLGLTRE